MTDNESPYAPPASTLERPAAPVTPVPARKLLRFANLIVDYIASYLVTIVLGVTLVVVMGDRGLALLESGPGLVLSLLSAMAYYIAFEVAFARTPGKFLTGTRVVNEFGQQASFGQIVGRSLSRFIPFEAFSFLGRTGRGWHDSIARTYVVRMRGVASGEDRG